MAKRRSKEQCEESLIGEGSGNVFADFGLPDAEELPLKAELARQICKRIQSLKLTQTNAAKRLGLQQPDVSTLMNGRYTGFSTDRFIGLLNRLDFDIEIVLRPQRQISDAGGTVRILRADESTPVYGT